jgi:hypothetical protein
MGQRDGAGCGIEVVRLGGDRPEVLGGDQLADVLDSEVVGSRSGVAELSGVRGGSDGGGE